MALQGAAFLSDVKTSSYFPEYRSARQDREKNSFPVQSNNVLKASVVYEKYSSQKYALEFTSKDGDKVSFSFESIEYQRESIDVSAKGSQEDIDKLKSFVKDELRKMSQEIVKSFLKDAGVETADGESINDGDIESKIPEYWNAENTSQRIFDFATSFFGLFKGEKGDFLNKIKDAIEKGFDQAKEMWGGEFPSAVSGLIKNTYDLVMEKLDKWAEEGNEASESQVLPQQAVA